MLEDRHMYIFTPAIVATDMDELVYIKLLNKDQTSNWEATDKGRIFVLGVWENSHMVSLSFFNIFTNLYE